MVRRHEGTAFMGGAHVFPGGRVDPADADADASWCDGADADLADYRVAAARELFEEAGVLLARSSANTFVSLAGDSTHARFKQYRHDVHEHTATLRAICERERLRLALDAIVMFAHWVTPPIDTRQFDTRFFLTRVPPAQVPAHDETETTHSAWLTAAGAIREAEAGRIILPPPTWTTLRELEPFATVDEALAWARQRRVVRRQPEALERDGHRMLVLPGDPLHPQPDPDAPLETRFVLVDRRWHAERA